MTADAAPAGPHELRHAFALFSAASDQLSGAYRELQRDVERLTRELARANDELRRKERLAAMGEMAAGLAHRLRTPLATALLYTTHLGDAALAPRERRGFADKALERLRHLERLIGDMLAFARGEAAASESVAVSPLLQELRETIEPQMARRGVRFALRDEAAGAALRADRNALAGALTSLLENALQASAPGGRIALCCSASANAIVFAVRDDGPGIAPEIQDRVFEPFFTTRSGGTGLGLAIVRAVAQSLGGTAQAAPVPGGGSEFVLRLPRPAAGARSAAQRKLHRENRAQ